MKICFVAPWAYKLFHPQGRRIPPFGGAEVQQFQLGRALAQDPSFEVCFFVGDFYPGQPSVETFRHHKKAIALYKTIRCFKRIPLLDSFVDLWRLTRAMKQSKADVYVLRGGGSLAGTVCFLAQKLFKKKFIYSSAHDRDSDLSFFKNHPFYINALFRYGVRHADALICQHVDQQRAFKKNWGLNAMVLKSIYPIPPWSPSSLNDRTYVLWVSRLQHWKQPEIFLHLAQQFPHESFLILTPAGTLTFASKCKPIKNLEIVEGVPFEHMDSYFKKAKLFVNTSQSEGFPNTFVQAAKNQTPIVSLSVNPEGLLEQQTLGVCAQGDFERLVHGVDRLLKDGKQWQKFSRNAYNYAKKNHDMGVIVEAYKNIFHAFHLL
jgi:glycosyltransferase involved in cell wall biosynthesis